MAVPTTTHPEAQQPIQSGPDATAEFYQVLSDPSRWRIKLGVPIFKAHERTDPATGNLIKVDVPKLYRIASNLQRMERSGVPIRMTLGHTEPGKPETQQPPVGGYYRNARVQPFGPKGEPAVVVDEWLDPQYTQQRKNFPYRSAEYYDDSEQITGVALLTRDPYLDLGVVAYHHSGPQATHYSQATERNGRHYYFLTGEQPMWPQGTPNPTIPNGVPPQPEPGNSQPPTVGVPQYVVQPPTQYTQASVLGAQQPTSQQVPVQTQYMSWPGPAHRPPSMQRTHPSGGAVYDRYGNQYANEPPSVTGGNGGMGGGGGGGNPLQTVYECLQQAVAALAEHLGASGGGEAPQAPFPPEEPSMSSRYANQPRRSQPQPRPRVPYNRPGEPMRTISGLPVGYQMHLEQVQYQLRQANDALKVLYYERDQSDTEACIAEISRLAAMGYNVGEYEVGELKKKPREERPAFLHHIATHYERIGTDMPPTILGDPTPGPAENANRPASRDEMEAALKMSANSPDPNAFTQALHYIRTNGGPNRISAFNAPPPQYNDTYGTWPEGEPAPQPGFDPTQPYGEPSANGNGY